MYRPIDETKKKMKAFENSKVSNICIGPQNNEKQWNRWKLTNEEASAVAIVKKSNRPTEKLITFLGNINMNLFEKLVKISRDRGQKKKKKKTYQQ